MRSVRIFYVLFVNLIILCCLVPTVKGQTLINGRIIDKESKEAISGATVTILSNKQATSADSNGKFQLPYPSSPCQVEVRAIGYKVVVLTSPKDSKEWLIELDHLSNVIETVSITHKGKYSNRNNKAVELIDLVIRHKNENRISGKDSLQFQQYDKLKFGLRNPKSGFKAGLKELDFFMQNIDSTSHRPNRLLTVYQEESNANIYNKKDPSRFKKQIYSQKKTEFDKRYINNPNMSAFINYMFQQVDVYDESIFILNKQFLSPIADNGKVFYKYFIVDTIFNQEGYFIQLAFEPRNETDLLFRGTLQVSMDGSYAVKKALLKMEKKANLNWVNRGELSFHYSKNEQGVMLLDTTNTFLELAITKNDEFFAERTSYNYDYQLNSTFPPGIFQGEPIELMAGAENKEPDRLIELSATEEKTYVDMVTLNNKPSAKALMAVGYLLAQGYHNLGKFEIGPLEYLYSRNNIEGNRFRIGGRTTQELTDKAYFEGYLAYGTDDNRLKYFLRSAVSLNGSSVSEFPAHYLEGSVQNDIMEPGLQISYLKGDSFFRSIRKNRPTKWFDTRSYQLQHVLEFGNHLSVTTGFTYSNRNTIGDLRLIDSGDPERLLTNITTSEGHIDLRWAPYEKFYYRNLIRKTIIEKYPVFNIVYTKGFEGLFNSNFGYDKMVISASKRFFLNQLGFADITLAGGKIWGTLPYTLLEMPNVRPKEDRHEIDYDLMNSMEFAADQYIKFKFHHQLQGFILNKIPFIKKLNLREIWGAQMFYGKLSDNNNPYLSNDVVEFDRNKDDQIITQVLSNTPYWEGSVGLDNILRVLRVEYVRRLTYQGLPDVNKDRFRVSININF